MPELTRIKIQPVMQRFMPVNHGSAVQPTIIRENTWLNSFSVGTVHLNSRPDSRWGNFPGVLLGWRASEEGFWKDNIQFINYFKLRASYGQMGMDPGNPFQYINSFGLSSGMVFGTGSSIETAVGPPVIANPNITWETQTTQNVGFESKFFNDLFSLNMEFFYNKREHILAPRDASVPAFSGLSLPNENIARVDNRGFEIEAGVHKNLTSDLRFDLTANISYSHNKVVFQDEPIRAVEWQQTTGHPYNAWLMYNSLGIFEDAEAVACLSSLVNC